MSANRTRETFVVSCVPSVHGPSICIPVPLSIFAPRPKVPTIPACCTRLAAAHLSYETLHPLLHARSRWFLQKSRPTFPNFLQPCSPCSRPSHIDHTTSLPPNVTHIHCFARAFRCHTVWIRSKWIFLAFFGQNTFNFNTSPLPNGTSHPGQLNCKYLNACATTPASHTDSVPVRLNVLPSCRRTYLRHLLLHTPKKTSATDLSSFLCGPRVLSPTLRRATRQSQRESARSTILSSNQNKSWSQESGSTISDHSSHTTSDIAKA